MSQQILGESPAVKTLLALIKQVCSSKTNILIIGESGTGKELVARMIHETGPLKNKPFVPVNCGAIPENLIESEMFGHKKGSFTGAVYEKPGLFETAHGGTLFLDEVGELPLGMQVKLLRALQERVIRKVGGNDDIRVDVRVIAATNRDLEAATSKGTFREDLYYRLNVIQIRTPPLRERKGDVRLLCYKFLERFAAKMGKATTGFDDDAMAALESHPWPGNIRELENTVERALTLENGPTISLSALPSAVSAARKLVPPPIESGGGPRESSTRGGTAGQEIRLPAPDFSRGALDLDRILGDVERTYLLASLEHAGGVKKKAAENLGITFRSIRYRLKKVGIAAGEDDSD